jgi:periplasmic protein TonB
MELRASPRFLLAAGAAIVLHAALLAPLRLSLTGVASVATPPSMLVRMLAPDEPTGSVPPATTAGAESLRDPGNSSMPGPMSGVPADSVPAAPRRPPPAAAAGHVGAGEPPSAAAVPRSAELNAVARPPGLPPAPNYQLSGLLDPGPQPLDEITPEYPPRAGQQSGVVVLRLLVNEQGGVDNVAVVRSEPRGFFEESALEAYGRARFAPGRLLGLPVKSQLLIEVVFATENRGASVSGRN